MHPDWLNDAANYCSEHSSTEPNHLKETVRFTWLNTINPRQLSGHLQGRFLAMMAAMSHKGCILEIGTFTGYSALCLAEGAAGQAMVHTVEADAELAFKARNNFDASPYSEHITVHQGPAAELLPKLQLQPGLVFIDADEQQYQKYCELCLPMLHIGGVMLFDNTLWSMKVLDEEQRTLDTDTKKMDAFNAWLPSLPGVEVVMLPLRDGLTMLRKVK